MSVVRLEEMAYQAWPAARVVDLDGWRLRFMDGVTRRGNSVWPNALGREVDLKRHIDRAEAAYREVEQRCLFQLSPLAQPAGLDAALADRGYTIDAPVELCTASARSVVVALEQRDLPNTTVSDAPSDTWLELAGRQGRYREHMGTFEGLLSRLEGRSGFATTCIDGAPVATGLTVLDGSWAGIFAMATLPAARRRGAGRGVLLGLTRWALQQNAQQLYLQVEKANQTALRLYRHAGFVPRYEYHYRVGPRV